ncbi:MAG: class I SAM-dependent methyltransferase [Roseococcus sp.]|nr:class I SAM-dependent methyltransferase [Roseococcus sp.]
MSGSMNEDAQKIWDERYGQEPAPPSSNQGGDPMHYTLHNFLYQNSIALPTTGRLDGWIVADVGERFMKPAVKKVLALGSGMAIIEEFLLKQDYAEHIVAYEFSENACRAAMERVAGTPLEGRLEMRSGDVLVDNLPSESFDVVFVQAAIHHFEKIDEMFAMMHRLLKPDGLLMYDEYVGDDHHIFSDEVVEILNQLNDSLEPRYRFDHLAGAPRNSIHANTMEAMMALDPSEGVHASRILPLTYQWFEVLQRRDFGGTLLRPFFCGILPNFDWNDERDRTVARMIMLVERMLLQKGVIPSHNTDIVARKRPKPLPPMHPAESARIGFADWVPPALYGTRPEAVPPTLRVTPRAPWAEMGGTNIVDSLRRWLAGRR